MTVTTDDNEIVHKERLVSREQAEAHLLREGTDRLRQQQATGMVNPIELAKALGVKNQMIYNYIRAGRIKTRENSTQKLEIAWHVAVEFAQDYLDRKAKHQAKIERELRGE